MRKTIIAFIVFLNLACNSASLSSNEQLSVSHSRQDPDYENIYLTDEYKGEGRLTTDKAHLPKYLFTTKLPLGLKHTTFAILKKEIEAKTNCIINGNIAPEVVTKEFNFVGDSLTLIEVFGKIHNDLPELDFYFAGPYVGFLYEKK